MTNYAEPAGQQAYRYSGAAAQYNNALRTTSPISMMVVAITRTRQHLRAALQHRQEKYFDLENKEKAIAINRLKALQAVIAPNTAPELSRDLFAFYARMVKLLQYRRKDSSMEERYEIVDGNLQTLARQWEKFTKPEVTSSPGEQTARTMIGKVL